jgi:hypothetical protein
MDHVKFLRRLFIRARLHIRCGHMRQKVNKYIQGVPGGKVNILGGHGIGHSKQKNFI